VIQSGAASSKLILQSGILLFFQSLSEDDAVLSDTSTNTDKTSWRQNKPHDFLTINQKSA